MATIIGSERKEAWLQRVSRTQNPGNANSTTWWSIIYLKIRLRTVSCCSIIYGIASKIKAPSCGVTSGPSSERGICCIPQSLICSKFLQTCSLLKSANSVGFLPSWAHHTSGISPISALHMSTWRNMSTQWAIDTASVRRLSHYGNDKTQYVPKWRRSTASLLRKGPFPRAR